MGYIYKIENRKNGKCYIGQSIGKLGRRLRDHKYMLNRGRHTNVHLQRAWNLDRPENFTFEILEVVDCGLEELNLLEQQYIDKYQALTKGYNLMTGGNNKHHSKESRVKMALAATGRKASAKSLEALKKGQYGSFPHREETKTKLASYTGANSSRFDSTIYKWENEKLSLCLYCTRQYLYQTYNLDPSRVTKVIKGKGKKVGGWTLK